MPELHKFYLSLGSNIEPGPNLAAAIDRLRRHGRVDEVSSAWESEAVGSAGPNFLNVCVALWSPLAERDLKNEILLPIERALGRMRSSDKNAPRTIDIDVVMMDEVPLNLVRWSYAFVIVPMAELLPRLRHPLTGAELFEMATQIQQETWIVRRPEALSQSPR